MSEARGALLLVVVIAFAVSGCGSREEPSPLGTGARAAATDYFDALAQRNWAAAYAKLDAESKRQVAAAAFARRAEAYVKRLGFDFRKAHLRSCDEQGEKATAHLTLSDRQGTRKHSYRESIMLRRDVQGWGVTLPANFGR